MPYTFYLVLHLFLAFLVISSSTYMCLSDTYSKKLSGLYGGFCFLLFVAGFGLLAKGGYSTSSGWVIVKLIAFFILAGGIPVIAKRFPALKKPALYVNYALLFLIIIMATLKPI